MSTSKDEPRESAAQDAAAEEGAAQQPPPEEAAAEGGADDSAENGAATEQGEEEAVDPLEAAQITAQGNYDKYLRLQAEFENYKKRLAKERAESLKFAFAPLLQDLVGIEDNLKRAVEHARKNEGDGVEAILSGVEMVSKQVAEIFDRYGMTRIEALGKTFDPNLHQAMGVVETQEVPENQVMEECQAGYTLHNRVVRPAMVIVSKRAEGGAKGPPAQKK